MLNTFRSRLVWKIFLTYLVIIIIGAVILIATIDISLPTAFGRHVGEMSRMMGKNNLMHGARKAMEMGLFVSFKAAVRESLTMAALATLTAAIIASYFISKQVVAPIRKMMVISHKIAAGDYGERLEIGDDVDHLDELDQMALSFNHMADELEKTEIMRQQLIGDVSHELRTPLTAIKGYIEGLLDGVVAKDEKTFKQIYNEADRLQRLVDDLQELSRVEAGVYTLSIKPVALDHLAENVVHRLRRQFEEKGIQLQVNIPPGLPNVLADEDRIIQVLTNILANALQYTPSAGKVDLSAKRDNDEVIVAVSDTGIGIAPQHLENVFKRFYRVDKSRSRSSGGSGIGLSIAFSIIKSHAGRMWAESEGPGKGSTFFFSLPIEIQKHR